jgi:hypothetical protein
MVITSAIEERPIVLHPSFDGAFATSVMTSFAFILGLLPLVVATGASELARRDVGPPAFGGMILASFIGIFAIPPLYVNFHAIRRPEAEHASACAESGACRRSHLKWMRCLVQRP